MMYLVETTKAKVVIDDLKRAVSPASPCWVTSEELRFSVCLQNLQKRGMVTVTRKSRSRVVKLKKPERHKARLSRKGGGRKFKPHAAPAQEDAGISKQELEALLAKTARQAAQQAAKAVASKIPAQAAAPDLGELEQRLTELVGGLVQTQKAATPESPDLGGIEKRLTDLVSGLVQQAQSQGSVGAPVSAGPEEPMFIPEGIVDSEAKAQLDMETTSLSDEDLTGIAAALKNLRKKTK